MEFISVNEREELPSFLDEIDRRITHLRAVKQVVDAKLDQYIALRIKHVEGSLLPSEMAEVLKDGTRTEAH